MRRGGLAGLLRDLTRDRPYLSRVPVRSDGRVRVIDLRHVDWLGAAGNYVALHCGPREYQELRHIFHPGCPVPGILSGCSGI